MQRAINLIFVFITILFLPVMALTQELPTQPDMQKIQKDAEKMKQQMENMQQEQLEFLKKLNPQAYQQSKAAYDRAKQIDAVISLLRQGKISSSDAERQLYPLIKEDLRSIVNSMDQKISDLEKKLDYCRKVRSNPEILVKKRIDELLGKSLPNPEDVMF
jgi:hypothetical protein